MRSAPREWLAGLVVFVALMPFERFWMPRLGAASGARPAVLLVHGYACNAGLWRWMRGRLIAAGYDVATVTLEPPFAGIEAIAERLHSAVEEFAATAPGGRIALVCHSMGGLVARVYLARHGARRIAKLITLGTPHAGTRIARYGVGQSAREMLPGSPFLRTLPNPATLGVSTAAIWSDADMIVIPPESARLAGAADHCVRGLGHLAMAFSPQVLRLVERELAP